MAAFFSLMTFWNRTRVYTYVSLPRGLTLWYGETYQLLLYEPFLIGTYCWGYTWLRDTRDANDRCAIDRKVDDLEVGTFTKELLSTLAVCGWGAATTVITYMVPLSWLCMTGDSHPALPSYPQSETYCGQPGETLCPGQQLKRIKINGLNE